MANLDIMINGDCASAVAALSATERAIGGVQSKAGSGVTAAVSVAGARGAVRDLNAVSTAITGTTAAAAAFRSGGPIAGGLGAGAVAARGLTGSLGGTTRAMSEARTGAAALASAVGRIGAGAARGGVLAGVLPSGGSASIMAASTAVNALRTSLAAQQLQSARGLPVMAMANAETRALAGNASSAAAAMTRLGGAPLRPGEWGANGGRFGGYATPDDGGGPAKNVPGHWGRNGERTGSSAFNPPPVVPPSGGGGGGGDGEEDAERRGTAAGKRFGEMGKEVGALFTAGLALGIAADAAVTKYATDAVNKTISETPVLAKASGDAMAEFGNGVRDASVAVADDAVPAFERLATAQRALGQETGKVGMENLATQVEGQAATADATTRAYIRMEPAMNAAIRASDNLGIAMINGISNPQVVNGVRSLSESLAKPEIQKGLQDITTGATGAGLVFAKVAADAAGFASRLVNTVVGGDNATDMSSAVTGGGMLAALGFSKYGLKGGLAAGVLGASGVGVAQYQMAHGQDNMVTPTIINEILGAVAGGIVTGGNPAGIAGGGLLAQGATAGLSQIPGPIGKRAPLDVTSAIAGAVAGFLRAGPKGALAGAAIGYATGDVTQAAAMTDPVAGMTGQSPDQFRQSKQQLLQQEYGKSHPGQQRPAVAPQQGQTLMEHLFGGGTPAGGEGPVQPGPQSDDKPKSQSEQLQARQQVTQARVQQEQRQYRQQKYEQSARAGTGYSAGQPLPQSTTAARDATNDAAAAKAAAAANQLLGQSAQQAQQSVQGLGQSAPQAAQQVQQLPAAFVPVQQLPSQASSQMKTASSIIQNSAQEVGSSIPPSISTGIVKQTPQVCDATANMGASMVKCAAGALLSASPSKKFVALGQSTGDGAKIGVEDSAGGAVGAVGSMVSGMLGQVGALGSGVTAASDGAVPMAESGGLMVGYVWARSVATGVDSVLRTADFASASMPAINSALAKTTLGKLGLLGVAGSGASISKTAGGGFVTMSAPAPVVNATFQVSVDGTPLQVIAQRQIDGAMDALADSFSRQRG